MSIDLKASVSTLQARTKAARLRALMPVIEAKVREGVSHAEIIAVLNEQGLAVNEMTYHTYLKRHRRKQAATSLVAMRPPSATDRSSPVVTVAMDFPSRLSGHRPPTFEHDPKGDPDLLK